MSEGKWTPGPWWIERYGDGDSLVIHSGEDMRVAFMATPGSTGDMKEIRANAALMAAAPELYEALRRLDAFWTECHPAGPDYPMMSRGENLSAETVSIWKAARKALLKASGGSDV